MGSELSSDSQSIDDDILRSVEAFSDQGDYGAPMDRLGSAAEFAELRGRAMSRGSLAPFSVLQGSIKSKTTHFSRTELKLLEHSDQPLKGMIFYLIYTVLYSLCFLCATYLYARNPNLNPFQMLLMRSLFALLIQAMFVNRELKHAVWDSIERDQVGSLVFRSVQGTLTNIINYSTAKFLPLTIIAICNNMGPLIALVLAFVILKERIKRFEVLMIVLSVCGILTVVLGGNDSTASDTGAEAGSALTVVLWTCLFINPFLTAGGSIAMRKMKKFHEAVVSFYLNWSIGISSLLMIFLLGLGFEEIAAFDWQSWLLSVGTGFFGVTSQTLRFKALKLQKASKLQKLQPLTTLEQFCFDVFLFHVPYTTAQYIGLGFMFSLYLFQGLKFALYDLPREKKRELKKIAEIERQQRELEREAEDEEYEALKTHDLDEIEEETLKSRDSVESLTLSKRRSESKQLIRTFIQRDDVIPAVSSLH